MTETQALASDEAREQAEDSQVEEGSEQAKATAKKAAREAERPARLVLTEAGYAALGLGGVTVDLLRQAPSVVRTLGDVVSGQVAQSFAALSRRGHKMLGSISLQDRREHDTLTRSKRSAKEPPPEPAQDTAATQTSPAYEPVLSAEPGDVEGMDEPIREEHATADEPVLSAKPEGVEGVVGVVGGRTGERAGVVDEPVLSAKPGDIEGSVIRRAPTPPSVDEGPVLSAKPGDIEGG